MTIIHMLANSSHQPKNVAVKFQAIQTTFNFIFVSRIFAELKTPSGLYTSCSHRKKTC
uniref:Uncharacterized protein n=1 Tax=Rhizophora mucronata TaxID=61149 RepID=A0A2P2LLU8_RHIMU